MMAQSTGRPIRRILKRAAMLLSAPFGDLKPVAMANRLLDERARGMKPVWPTTDLYADQLVEGFEELQEVRGPEIIAAILVAPVDTHIDWPQRFNKLIS